MWVFSEIMGLPVDDRKLLIELGDKLLGNSDPDVVGEENVAERALSDPELRLLPFSSPFSLDLIEYGCRLGEARRREPRDDITTRLVRGRGRRLASSPSTSSASSSSCSRRPATRRRGTRSASACSICWRTRTRLRGSSPIRRSPAPRRTRSCGGRIPFTTSAARRRATSTVHGQRIEAGRQGHVLVRLGQLRRGALP